MTAQPVEPVPREVREAHATARFGTYIRTVRLGAGATAEVWKAWDLDANRWVALKFLKGADADEVAGIQREARTAAALSHPHIARNFGVANALADPFVVLQFIDGHNLADFPRKDPKSLARVIRDAAEAVHYAHLQGFVHRNLKPQNVMVDRPRGGAFHVFVMDFGLARSADAAFMAPEQARGEPVDGRADVYSLGATLHAVLTGKSPGAKTAPPLDPNLEAILLKCVQKDPAGRYQTMQDLADDLRRWEEGAQTKARPAKITVRVRQTVSTHKSATVAALVTAVALMVVLGMFLASPGGDERSPENLKGLYDRGSVRIASGDFSRAVVDLEKALALAPDDWSFRPEATRRLEVARAGLKK